ncbi:WecB/TagA/CpsF family glycosyltransferase [Leisingera sp. S232]|uniref:WecB/TagA/CpsF family glycosyltransferase n=1 Tax=Leisingera sp. S232 TaxID=3415132 RepID=UPI000869BCCC|nr:glycosyl transferase [Rhodobacteraceae bacterium (ex Bugula neritina AB1)]
MFFELHGRRVAVNMPAQAMLEAEIRARFATKQGFALATVNLDHLVKMQEAEAFLSTYQAQDLVVADGRPIVWLSWIARRRVELMPGSDMVLPLCRLAAQAAVPVVLAGSTQEALKDAEAALTAAVPGLEIAWIHAPSGRFDPDGSEGDQILHRLDQTGPCLCFLALGAPKQERLAQRGRRMAPHVGFASVGAGLDFLGGHQKRAPAWVRAIAMEWLWRALSNPVRLLPRYGKCLAILPRQIYVAWRIRAR